MKIGIKDTHQLRKILLEKGYSQRSFAHAVGITPPYLNQLLNEERSPSAGVAKKMAGELESDFNDIFFIADDCKSYQN